MSNLGDFLRRCRTDCGYSQMGVASKLKHEHGLRASAVDISNMERGHRPVSEEMARALEKVYFLDAGAINPESFEPAERTNHRKIRRAGIVLALDGMKEYIEECMTADVTEAGNTVGLIGMTPREIEAVRKSAKDFCAMLRRKHLPPQRVTPSDWEE